MMKLIVAFRNFARTSKNTRNLRFEVTDREQRLACYNVQSRDCKRPACYIRQRTLPRMDGSLGEGFLRQAQKIYVNII